MINGTDKILVIEDNPINMELVVDLLESAGYSVIAAENAKEGIALAKVEAPDLILMDLALPGMDGLAAIEMLRADPRTSGFKTIVLTAYAMRGDEERAWGAGCVGYVTKPIDTRQFLRTVADVLCSFDARRLVAR